MWYTKSIETICLHSRTVQMLEQVERSSPLEKSERLNTLTLGCLPEFNLSSKKSAALLDGLMEKTWSQSRINLVNIIENYVVCSFQLHVLMVHFGTEIFSK